MILTVRAPLRVRFRALVYVAAFSYPVPQCCIDCSGNPSFQELLQISDLRVNKAMALYTIPSIRTVNGYGRWLLSIREGPESGVYIPGGLITFRGPLDGWIQYVTSHHTGGSGASPLMHYEGPLVG